MRRSAPKPRCRPELLFHASRVWQEEPTVEVFPAVEPPMRPDLEITELVRAPSVRVETRTPRK